MSDQEMLSVSNFRESRIVVRSDPRGIPGGQTVLLPANRALDYKSVWGDDVEVQGMQRVVEAPEWQDKTAKELIELIESGEMDSVLEDISDNDPRVTVQRAVEARLSD